MRPEGPNTPVPGLKLTRKALDRRLNLRVQRLSFRDIGMLSFTHFVGAGWGGSFHASSIAKRMCDVRGIVHTIIPL